MRELVFNDGLELERIRLEADRVTRIHESVNEDAIMKTNERVRSEGGARNLTFGRPILQMSYAQYLILQKRFPELKSRDPQDRQRGWLKVFNDPDWRKLQLGGR